ncbi:MAG: hypothetical protein HQM08_03465 [Candidatus Riflebacteria bacterium]|nr:hypothetical protein [Candidatus Riflebacteria bacterium]
MSFARKLGNTLSGQNLFLEKIVPNGTLPVSLTGSRCELNCSHCEGHYLQSMKPFSSLMKSDFDNYSSFLISGGSDRKGIVPVAEFVEEILKIPRENGLNLHIGFQGAEKLKKLFPREKLVVSYDLIGNQTVLNDVFGLSIFPSDLEKKFLEIKQSVRVVPHLIIGLSSNDFSGEKRVMQFIRENGDGRLTILVFRPTPRTKLADLPLPSLFEIAELFERAICDFGLEITLGCMRPIGIYRKKLDLFCWLAGVRKIVNPDRSLVKALEEQGIPIRSHLECCAFIQ